MLNHIDVMGRFTKDPELRTTQNGNSVTTFTLAVDRDFQKDQADFFECVAWRQTAEFVSKYFKKGQLAVVSGKMQSREFTDKNNNKRKAWEIQCENVYFGESKRRESKVANAAVDVQMEEVDDGEELPF